MTEEEKLDKLLSYYRKMMVDHDKFEYEINKLSNELFVANTLSSVFRIYKQRLIIDALIIEDVDVNGVRRWMTSHKGLTYSYVVEKDKETTLLREKKDRLRRMERNEVLLVIGRCGFLLVEILIHRKDLLSLFYCH